MDTEVSRKLKQLWMVLNDNLKSEVRDKWWNHIEDEYTKNKNRKYYDMNHIAKLFIQFEEYQKEIKSAKAVSYAIFFKSLHYDPKSLENEEKSCELFQQFATEANISSDDPIRKEVIELIILTKTHLTEEHKSKSVFGTDDKHYFLDFDMSYLGSKADDYAISALRIRDEYQFMSENTYKQLRAKVLKSLLEIPKIFATKLFYDKYEEIARNNINNEIDILKA